MQHAEERSELEKLREKVKVLQEKLKQQKTKSSTEDGVDGPGAEKLVVEEVIKEDRVRVRTVYMLVRSSREDRSVLTLFM